jgi:hypothetical protein
MFVREKHTLIHPLWQAFSKITFIKKIGEQQRVDGANIARFVTKKELK